MSLGTGVVTTLPKNRYIRNVVGSSNDPTIPGIDSGWIGLWTKKTGKGVTNCCVCGNADRWIDAAGAVHHMIGGHIVLGGASDMPGGAASKSRSSLCNGNRVFITPICDYCNGQSADMWVTQDTYIVQLCGFMGDRSAQYEIDCLAIEMEPEDPDWDEKINDLFSKKQKEFDIIVTEQNKIVSWDVSYLRRSVTFQASSPSTPSVSAVLGIKSATTKPTQSHIWKYGKSDYVY